VPAAGRTILTDADRKVLSEIRQAESLRWLAYERRDELIVIARDRGIKISIIASAAGFSPTDGGYKQVYKVLRRPFKRGMPKPGRRRVNVSQ
jgi:hypothetical protein